MRVSGQATTPEQTTHLLALTQQKLCRQYQEVQLEAHCIYSQYAKDQLSKIDHCTAWQPHLHQTRLKTDHSDMGSGTPAQQAVRGVVGGNFYLPPEL